MAASFDPAGLPFDSDAMLAGLQPWIECESPTYDVAAVDRMIALAAADLAAMGAQIEMVPGRGGCAGCVRARFGHARAGEPGILIAGHMDTVHPIGTLDILAFRRDGAVCYGPGIQDMKGGNYLALEAIRQLAAAGIATKLPVTVLFTSDEEIGTPSTRGLIETEARANKYVLVPEPARRDGGLVTGRYAIARYRLTAEGQPSHAGAYLAEGHSAIREMARRVSQIEDMTGDDCTFSVGVIRGGQWVNCVSSLCEAEALSMAKRQEDLDDGVRRMLALTDTDGPVRFRVERGVTRPVWPPDQPGTLALFETAKRIAGGLGFDVTSASQGGGSDGNFTGALGIPTLDGLGPRGAGLHTLSEHIVVDSLAERGRLMAGLLAELE
ncbi:MAG: M20/M25/M40 family metallo-hydrolase [Pseudomonadota bacterium]